MKKGTTYLRACIKHYGFIFLLLIVFIIPAIFSLFHPGFFVTDDGEWMIIRSNAFYHALRDGQFPVRFLHHLNFDYGYPVATFLYPGFLYASVFFQALKINVIDTMKLLFGLSLIGSGFFTYFWLAKIFKQRLAAFVGAFIAVYVPYHLYDVYVRGSIGEVFALLWVPFLLWMIERRSIVFTGIGIFFLILSHNTLAALFLPFIFVYALLQKTWSIRLLFLTFLLGVSMATFFFLPVMQELSLTQFGKTTISNPHEYFADIRLIGFSSLCITLLAGVFFIRRYRIVKEKYLVVFILFVTFATLFLSSSIGGFIWHIIPHAFIQFPFRFLSYLVVTLPFLAAFIIISLRGNKRYAVAVFLIGLSFASAFVYLRPTSYFVRDAGFYTTIQPTTTIQDEYMPVWVKEKPLVRPQQKVLILKGGGTVDQVMYNNKQLSFHVRLPKPAIVQINTLYWPGWEIFIDGNKTVIPPLNVKGGMDLDVPQGEHQVLLRFSETPLRLVSDIVSFVAFVLLLILAKFYKVK